MMKPMCLVSKTYTPGSPPFDKIELLIGHELRLPLGDDLPTVIEHKKGSPSYN